MYCNGADEIVLTLQVKNGTHPHPQTCQIPPQDYNTDKV